MSAARRYLIAGLVIGLTLIVSAIIIRATDSNDSGSTGQAVAETENEAEAEAEAEEEGGPRAGIEEAQEEAEVTASRLEALHAAQAAGKFGSKVAATTSPATGWVGPSRGPRGWVRPGWTAATPGRCCCTRSTTGSARRRCSPR